MDRVKSKEKSPSPLGLVLLLYIVTIILIITFAPFRFESTNHILLAEMSGRWSEKSKRNVAWTYE